MTSTTPRAGRALRAVSPLCAALVLAACGSTSHRAPVEERTATPRATAGTPTPAPTTAPAPGSTPAAPAPDATKPPPPGIENAGKPGYYTVKPGDTLIRIGLENGQNWRDIARWSNIENPNLIEVGQVVRVVPPSQDPTAVVTKPVVPGKVDTRAVPGAPGAPGTPTAAAPGAAPGATASAGAASASPPAAAPVATPAPAPVAAAPAPAPAPLKEPDEDLGWVWPAAGPVTGGFDETRSKGLAIAGKQGDPVLAAADGRVVYAGSGLRGYGNLIIVKHNNTFLSAYAHNQTLLVKEDQVVRKGQKIAEMGSSDSDRVQLHFEIRRQGKPVDPARLLPPR